jgi:hypothetical protein
MRGVGRGFRLTFSVGSWGTGWGFRLTFSVKRWRLAAGELPKKYKTLHPHPVPQ